MQFSFAQEKTVTGVVSDATGPLPGANVVVKGTTRGTQTDFDGKYAIKAKAGEVLEISFIGLKNQSITIGSANVYNVKLTQDASVLDEVVVTAFGIKRKPKELTYATQKVDAQELVQATPVNAVTALAGKVSGLNIITKNNGVNPSTAIILRGYRSLTGDNAALIVVDGVIQSQTALDNINPNDIESINVLKGGASTALYGSQGRNGALIVTTKQGRDKGLEVMVNTSYVVESVKYFPELQTTFGPGFDDQYDPYENTSWGPRFDGVPRRLGPILADGSFQTVNYSAIKNNRKDFFVDGVTSINGISLNGGDATTTYFFSAQRTGITGITPKDEYVKNNFRLNASKKAGKFKIGTNISYYAGATNVVGAGGYQGRDLYWSVINTPANVPLTSYKDWRNNKFAQPEGYFNEYYQNPYMLVDIARDRSDDNRLMANAKFEYEFNSWLSASYSLTGTYFNSYFRNTREAITYNPALAPTRTDANTPASVAEGFSRNTRVNSDLLFTAQRKLGEKLKATLILGNAVNSFKENRVNVSANNLNVPDLYNISTRTGEVIAGSLTQRSQLVGYLADLTLVYNDFLSINGAYRNEQSSTLPLGSSFDFYNIGAAINLDEAIPGLKGDILKFWKINASYSSTGFAPSIGYINENYFTPAGFPFGSVVGYGVPTSGASANFVPASTKGYEIGTEMGLFKSRLNIGVNYFDTQNTNDFLSVGTSTASGINSLRTNGGKLNNKGFEIDVNGAILKTQNFEWRAGVNVTKFTDINVEELSDGAQRLQTGLATSEVGVFAAVGKPFPALYGTAYTRDENGRVVIDATTGDPIVSSDLKYLGSTSPDLIVGLNTSIKYKSLTLTAVADYRTGHKYYNNLVDALEFTGSTLHSVTSGRQPFIFPNSSYESAPGVYTANTNITTSSGGFDFWNNTYNSIKENYVVDATTFKLREIALTYNFPERFLKNTLIKNISLGAFGRNLLMLRSAQNKYTDPEFTLDSQQFSGFGTQAQLPPTASYGFKLDVKF
jgi:TonB-linked SusC/RagA family outer membrane protein